MENKTTVKNEVMEAIIASAVGALGNFFVSVGTKLQALSVAESKEILNK